MIEALKKAILNGDRTYLRLKLSKELNLWARWKNGESPQAIDLREWRKINS